MSIHIVVDGYNLIRQSPQLRAEERIDIERGRKALNRRLAEYQKIKRHKVTVVYDGTRGYGVSSVTVREEGVKTIYSGQIESADEVIMRMSGQRPGGMLVVTSDRAVADYVAAKGADVISSPEFESRMELAEFTDNPESGEGMNNNSYEGRINTRKKGPSHRLPRKQRHMKSLVKKL